MSIRERRRELRFKKAHAAQALLDEIFDFRPSEIACQVFDEGSSFDDATIAKKGRDPVFTKDEMLYALKNLDDTSRRCRQSRRCFDALAYYFMRMEHALCINLIELQDVEAPMAYYVRLLTMEEKTIIPYLKKIQYYDAISFMKRFSQKNLEKEKYSQAKCLY